MQERLKIYLAGPEVFLPEAKKIGQAKKALCAEYGFEGLFPFDNEVPQSGSGDGIDRSIYRANVAMIHASRAPCLEMARAPRDACRAP